MTSDSGEKMPQRSWGRTDEAEMPRSPQRKQTEKYLSFRRAGFSHELALRYSR